MSSATAGPALALMCSAGANQLALRLASGEICSPEPSKTDLNSQVQAAFAQQQLRPEDLGSLYVDLGPGSYTGLRIAVTFARFAQSYLNIPVFTTTSLQCMALAAWESGQVDAKQKIRPVLDARRQRFHHALVELQETAVLLQQPAAVPHAELLASLQADEVLLASKEVQSMLQEQGELQTRLLSPVDLDASLLFHPKLGCKPATSNDLDPLYLMGSYAES